MEAAFYFGLGYVAQMETELLDRFLVRCSPVAVRQQATDAGSVEESG